MRFDTSLDPLDQFNRLLKEAIAFPVPEADAMTVATVSKSGEPSARIVYFKEISKNGFVFYGNYNSQKGQDIEAHPQVCLNFHWPILWQQVRIHGIAEKVEAELSDRYFATRARSSQIGAWASEQSKIIPDKAWLEKRVKEFTEKFHGMDVPRPPHWGGWRVIPTKIEFWFGLSGRLHDRYVYEKTDMGWKTYMKSP